MFLKMAEQVEIYIETSKKQVRKVVLFENVLEKAFVCSKQCSSNLKYAL